MTNTAPARPNRWVIAVAGMIVMICLGTVYSWSLFTRPLIASFGWSDESYGFGVMPSFNADYFGTRHMGQNYGMILTAWGVAGIVGPLIAATVKDRTGSFTGALLPVAIMLLIAAIIPFFIRKPETAARRTVAAG